MDLLGEGALSGILPFVAAVAFALVVAKTLNYTIKKTAARLAKRTATVLDDLVVDALDQPLTLWITGICIYAAAYFTGISGGALFGVLAMEFAIAVGAFTAYKLLNALLHWYVVEIAPKSNLSLGGLENTVRRVGALVIIGIALIMMLDKAGVEVSPLIASMGIAGLAVALAFQDTLGNFFAGVHISVDRPIREGDYIQLDSGQEGYVHKIGWRSTQIRQTANNTIIVPNSKLAASIITNFYAPQRQSGVVVPVSVAYGTDLGRAEKVALAAAMEIQRSAPGAARDFEPLVRYTGFGESGISFNVVLRVEEYPGRFVVVHEFIKELHSRFKAEGIEIPYPKRDVYLQGLGTPKPASKAKER